MPTSRATVLTCSANVPSVLGLLLMVSARAATSPWRRRSDVCHEIRVGNGVTTLTMPRTLRRQVRRHEIHVVGENPSTYRRTPGTRACPPSLPSHRLRGPPCHLFGERAHGVFRYVVEESCPQRNLAFAWTTSFCFRSPFADSGHDLTMPRTLGRQIAGHEFTLSVRFFRRPRHTHLGLSAEAASSHRERHG